MEKYALNKKQIILFLASIIASTIAFLIIDVYAVLHYYNGSISGPGFQYYLVSTIPYLLLLIIPILTWKTHKKEVPRILIVLLVITFIYIFITFTPNFIFFIPLAIELAFVVFYYE